MFPTRILINILNNIDDPPTYQNFCCLNCNVGNYSLLPEVQTSAKNRLSRKINCRNWIICDDFYELKRQIAPKIFDLFKLENLPDRLLFFNYPCLMPGDLYNVVMAISRLCEMYNAPKYEETNPGVFDIKFFDKRLFIYFRKQINGIGYECRSSKTQLY